jgi:CelD/BcsL family acetyltransferase involved in cellulose biosynthesis
MLLPTTVNPSGAHMAALGGSWEEFYSARRSASTRRRDRNKRRRLAKIGDVRLVTAEGSDEIGATLEALFAQKSRQLAAMGVANIFADAGTRAFFLDVATDPRNRDLVHVSSLQVAGCPAAVNLGLVHRGTYAHVLVSHDSGETARFGAGTAHLHELMAYAIARGCHTFDFTIGDEPYKREWSDRSVALYDYRSAVTARGLLATAPAALVARMKRMVKQNPALWRLAVSVRALRAGRKEVGPETRDSGEDE